MINIAWRLAQVMKTAEKTTIVSSPWERLRFVAKIKIKYLNVDKSFLFNTKCKVLVDNLGESAFCVGAYLNPSTITQPIKL